MQKILFVCHGNICRSPMAEMMMKHLVSEAGRDCDFIIDSCATSTEEIGNDIYPPAKDCLRRHGIPFERRQARQIQARDYQLYDHIFLMDRNNMRWLRFTLGEQLLKQDAALKQPKIQMIMSLVGVERDVADPWYTGNFEDTYNDLLASCSQILKLY